MKLDLAGLDVGHDATEFGLGGQSDPAVQRTRAEVEMNGTLDRIHRFFAEIFIAIMTIFISGNSDCPRWKKAVLIDILPLHKTRYAQFLGSISNIGQTMTWRLHPSELVSTTILRPCQLYYIQSRN